MEDIESRLNELAAGIRTSGLNARKERLTRTIAAQELEQLSDKLERLRNAMEVKYGRDEPLG